MPRGVAQGPGGRRALKCAAACVTVVGHGGRMGAAATAGVSRDGALRNRAAGHWVPGPAAEQPVTAAKNRWCAEFAAGCLPVACIHASAASQLPVGSGPARPHGEVGYWEAAGQNRVEFFCHFPALSSRLLSAPSLVAPFRAGLPAAGAGAEQAGCGWDVFIETWTQQQKLRSGSKARSLCWDDQLSELKSEPA